MSKCLRCDAELSTPEDRRRHRCPSTALAQHLRTLERNARRVISARGSQSVRRALERWDRSLVRAQIVLLDDPTLTEPFRRLRNATGRAWLRPDAAAEVFRAAVSPALEELQ